MKLPSTSNTRILFSKISQKGVVPTLEYLEHLKKLKAVVETNPDIKIKSTDVSVNKSYFSMFRDAISPIKQLERSLSHSVVPKAFENYKEQFAILNVDNNNDPAIDLEYINNIFSGNGLKEALNQISEEYLNTDHQKLILDDYRNEMLNMYNALNGEIVDVDYIKRRFESYYSETNIYNGQLRGQKLRHDILMFKQAFERDPNKFSELDDLIPVNLATSIDVMGIVEPKVVCHSIGGFLNADSLKYAHEILISRAASAKFNIVIFAMLDQKDEETNSILKFFSSVGKKPQDFPDVAILDEDNWTYSQWDIKTEYLRVNVSRKFAQKIVQIGAFSRNYEDFDDKFILEALQQLQKDLKSDKFSDVEKAALFKRHSELVSYLFCKDPILLVSNSYKDYFKPIKLIMNLSSYQQNK